MIVFLVGGESRLMDALITKMEKDGHKTYLLTGKRDGRGKYRRVFERYNFPYDSESVREIFTNVNPDLVIFLGAYDTNYDWRIYYHDPLLSIDPSLGRVLQWFYLN